MDDAIVRRRALPPGGAIERWAMRDGWRLRVARWPGSRGTLLFLNGRADFIEKYAEALWWWRARGWAVAAFDWRGQGGSGRPGRTPLSGDVESFDIWRADGNEVLTQMAAAMPGPLVAVAHSMGGCLLAGMLAAGERRIARAALIAPMLGIAGPLGPAAAGAAARLMVRAGRGGAFGPGQRATLDADGAARRAAVLTSDPERRDDEAWWLAAHPELALGGVTWGWLAAAYAAMAELARPGALARIETPVLALLARGERVVDNAAAARVVAALPRGRCEVVDGRHELLRERDDARRAVMERLDLFLEQA